MSSLQKVLDAQTKEVPRRILKQLVVEKLESNGVQDVSGISDEITEHILSGNNDSFEWNDGNQNSPETDIELTFSDNDLEEFSRRVSTFLKDEVPTLVQDIADQTAKDCLKSIKSQFFEYDTFENALLMDFRENLQDRWGKAIDLLRLHRAISLEIGEDALKRLSRSKARKRRGLRSILIRLHARACQITSEVITLLSEGYADGAMARWRTLYEIMIVSTVISDGGEEVATRYIDHEIVDTKTEMDEYEKNYVALGYRPIAKREKRQIENAYTKAINEYGRDFRHPYGWATELLGNRSPTFKDLEIAAKRTHMRSFYKFASQDVHASAKRMTSQLSNSSDENILVAGPSNSGLEEPGQNTALTLAQITALLIEERRTSLDTIVQLKTALLLSNDVGKEFNRAARKLRKDELAINRLGPD